MKNEDVIARLEAIQAYAETELVTLMEELRDDGWEEDDVQTVSEARSGIARALLRVADLFPTEQGMRVLQPSPMSYEKFRERYKLPDDAQAKADYQEYLQPGTLTALLADLQGDGPIRTPEHLPKM
jgi:hypothetical protein